MLLRTIDSVARLDYPTPTATITLTICRMQSRNRYAYAGHERKAHVSGAVSGAVIPLRRDSS
jgi:hypothetical protein